MGNKRYETLEDFYNDALNYFSIRDMSKGLKTSDSCIVRYLKKLEKEKPKLRENLRTIWESKRKSCLINIEQGRTTYNFNDYAFHNLTPISVYWLGMIASDGCVYKNRNRISINAKYKDKTHIETFAEFLNYTGEVKERLSDCKGKKFPSVYLELNSSIMKNKLIELGIKPHKSNEDIDYLIRIPEGLKIFFIFGYLDGDGSVSVLKEKSSGKISMIGNFSFLSSVKEYLNKNFLIEFNLIKDDRYNNVKYNLNITQFYSVYLFCSLYLSFNSVCELERKREKCIELFNLTERKLDLNSCLKYHNSNFINLNKSKNRNNKQQKERIKNNKCSHCGKPIREEAKTCEDYWHKLQRKVERPSREVLKEEIRTTPFLKLSEKYEVSDNAIKKWCKSYGLPYKKSEIKLISDEDWIKV